MPHISMQMLTSCKHTIGLLPDQSKNFQRPDLKFDLWKPLSSLRYTYTHLSMERSRIYNSHWLTLQSHTILV